MNYNVPEDIHPEMNIVTSEILGKTHYALERVYKVGKWRFPVIKKVYDGVLQNCRIDSNFGNKWHINEMVIKRAIQNDRSQRIERYIEKHVR